MKEPLKTYIELLLGRLSDGCQRESDPAPEYNGHACYEIGIMSPSQFCTGCLVLACRDTLGYYGK